MCIRRFVRVPLNKFSKKYIKTRSKQYPGEKVPKHSFNVSDTQIDAAFNEFWTKVRQNIPVNRSELCGRHFGKTDTGKPRLRKSFDSWVKKGYTRSAHIPRSGPKPVLGTLGEAAVMGYIGQRNALHNGMDDDSIRWTAASAANKLHPDASTKYALNKTYPKSKRNKYGAYKNKPQPTTKSRQRCNIGGKLIVAHGELGSFMEETNFKEPGGNIYEEKLASVWVFDESGGADTTGPSRVTRFEDEEARSTAAKKFAHQTFAQPVNLAGGTAPPLLITKHTAVCYILIQYM